MSSKQRAAQALHAALVRLYASLSLATGVQVEPPEALFGECMAIIEAISSV
jgi:hypothetical protein